MVDDQGGGRAMVAQPKRMSVAEFMALPDDGNRHELVEVIGASEKAADVAERVQDYLAGGAHRVWCVYPQHHTVHIHDAAAPTRVVRGAESLTDEELLPGFALPLDLIFPEL
jgi:Uma2 family endonuclease